MLSSTSIYDGMRMPMEVETLILMEFIDPVQRWEIYVHNAGIRSDSEGAIRMLLGVFGYDPYAGILLDDRDNTCTPRRGLLKHRLHYIWCHDAGRTNELVKHSGLCNVVIVGTIQGGIHAPIQSANISLQAVVYLLPWVTSITDGWMKDCLLLANVRFTGMYQLQSVGDGWLQGCESLVAAEFQGLPMLRSVGCMWLGRCTGLQWVHFPWIPNLEYVGGYWLYDCSSLCTVEFVGLDRLAMVGNSWLHNCGSLTAADFRGLQMLRTVGNFWLGWCVKMTSVRFGGLRSLESVGTQWLSKCGALISVEFDGLDQLTVVGSGWLQSCRSLMSVDFKGLPRLRSVGNMWMGHCAQLTTIDESGLRSLASVGILCGSFDVGPTITGCTHMASCNSWPRLEHALSYVRCHRLFKSAKSRDLDSEVRPRPCCDRIT